MCKPGDELIPYLERAGCDKGVIEHCITVRDVAIRIAAKLSLKGVRVDSYLVAKGAIIHDIGRSVTHGMDHADKGYEICKTLGFGDAISSIVRCHIGAGLTSEERISFGLKAGDSIPQTIEEKIVAHADNLVKGSRVMSGSEFLNSLKKFPDSIKNRFLNLATELDTFGLEDLKLS